MLTPETKERILYFSFVLIPCVLIGFAIGYTRGLPLIGAISGLVWSLIARYAFFVRPSRKNSMKKIEKAVEPDMDSREQ
jgi:hypothetical protein